MDINNNQQINTFLKGMNTDVSDALIDSSQYRYAENLRLVTNTDSNEGELRIIEGTGRAYSGPWEKLIALTSIRNYVIVIAETSYIEDETECRGISIFTNTNKGIPTQEDPWRCIVNNVPYEEFLQEGENDPHLSLVTRWESEKNIKLYIAGGVTSIICLNICNDYSKLPHNTIRDIAQYVKTNLAAPTVTIISGGKIKSARVQYAYRLYTIGEPSTHISPLSGISSIYKTQNTGYMPEELTVSAAKVTIPAVENNFERIQIFRINYVVLNQPPLIDLIYDGPFVDSIVDYGNSIEGLSVDEFISNMSMPIIPKIIESKNDYMLAGNIRYTQDDLDETLKNLDFRAYSYGDFETDADILPDTDSNPYRLARVFNKQYEASNQGTYNVQYWRMPTVHDIGILGGVGKITSWRYSLKKYFIDKHNTVYDDQNNILNEPAISLQRGEVYRYGIIIYNKDGLRSSVKWIADIMIPQGNSEDFDPSHRYFNLIRPDLPKYDSLKNKWEFVAFGINFEVNVDLIPDCAGFEIVRCKRRYQDCYTVTQGIVGIPERVIKTEYHAGQNTKTDTEIIQPNGFMTTEDLTVGAGNSLRSDRDYVLFASPEYAYQPDDIQDVVKSERTSLYLEDVQSYYIPLDIGVTITYHVSSSGMPSWLYYATGSWIFGGNGANEDYEISNIRRFKSIGDISNRYAMYLSEDYDNEGTHHSKYNIGGLRLGAQTPDSNAEQFRPYEFLESRNNNIFDTSVTNVAAINKIDIAKHKTSINSYAFPKVPKATDFFSGKQAIWKDAVTPINAVLYLAWTCGYEYDWRDEDMYDSWIRESTPTEQIIVLSYPTWCPVSSTGKCIVFKVDNPYPEPSISNDDCVAPITVTNLRKYAIPYNGPESYEKNSPDYCSYGNYSTSGNGGWVPITVFDGDCYLGIFTYHSAHAFDNELFITIPKAAIIYYVPVESSIDLKATYGDLYTRVENRPKSYYIQDEACAVDGWIQDKDAYLYNTAYNANPDIVQYSTIDYTRIDFNDFDCRIHHSELKTNNERIDNWTKFKALNYIDVDSRFGEITNMRLFKDKLLYWQNNATGIVSVNERTILNDQDENEIVLGTGGVLQRFDYISTLYGMKKNQYEAEVQSNATQYWWDGHNKEICAYRNGMSLVPLTKAKNLRNYINKHDEQDKPTLVYNPRYDEIISSVVEERSLVFNEKIEFFTSVYGMMPQFRTIVNDTTIVTDQTHLYHMDSAKDNITLLESAGNDIGSVKALPKLQYVVNHNNTYVKVFDISTFGGRFYGGDEGINALTFTFKTPLKQQSTGTGSSLITNREYDFRLDIPRNADSSYGDRMRGKTMQCELKSSSNSGDFSLQYIITKYRMSWS